MNALGRRLEEYALAEGFTLASVLDLDLAREAIAPHVARYDAWIADGRAGAMQYLERGRDRRADPTLVLPGARSILCVALPYPKRAGGAGSESEGVRYARYIHGRDYHEEIAARLERVMARVMSQCTSEGAAPHASPLRWKICVDTSAVLERSWAALAGLGWIGKNTLLIHPQLGSYFFIGSVLLDQVTGQGPRPLPDYCGRCTRCLDACPTRAITEPHALDSRKCISYWTLEKRGELAITDEQRRSMGTWVAGCDLCQEACPFNLKPVRAAAAQGESRIPGSADDLAEWRELLAETPDQYRARVADSSLSRIKPAQFSRNLAIALSNAVSRGLAANGALRALEPLAKARLDSEMDPFARAEWVRCVEALTGSSTS